MKHYTFVGRLASYDRLPCSTYGNPAFSGTFVNDAGEVLSGRTTSNASCAYCFLNWQNQPREVTYHYTRAGRVHFDYIKVLREEAEK